MKRKEIVLIKETKQNEFVRKDKDKTSPLAAGEYVLGIELADNNQGGRVTGVFAIPFRISE